MKFFEQVFDAPVEIVIAQGRAVLAAFSLAAITIDPTEPKQLAPLVAATLILYAAYSVALLGALHRRYVRNPGIWLVHSVDLLIVAVLLSLTDGFSSPFLVFFTFALLAASLRWDWPGIAYTMIVLVAIATVAALVDVADGGSLNLNQAIVRAAYLIATGTILAYASAHRQHERNRLLSLTKWPAVTPGGSQNDAVAESLRQAASILEASRALVVWEDDDANMKAASWEAGVCQVSELPTAASGVIVPSELERLSFSRTFPNLDSINLADGSVRDFPNPFRGDLAAALDGQDFSTAPFRGLAAKGRLFILGNILPSDDHLPLTGVIADRVGAELDRKIFLDRATRDAALRERSDIMRDLHDSLLQSLTAARTHLEILSKSEDRSQDVLATVRELLRIEQQRVREFVDASLADDGESVEIEMLRPLAEESAQLWGCSVTLDVSPSTAQVTRKTLNQLSLMLAEAIANAVRHGDAGQVRIVLTFHNNGRIEIEVRDDGRGFSGINADSQSVTVPEAALPRSLSARMKAMGGQLKAWTSSTGSVLRLDLSA